VTGVRFDATLSAGERLLLADAQTSGGLLLAVAKPGLAQLLAALEAAGAPAAAEIGEVTSEAGATVVERGG
jgi:selenide,water dikinase